MSAVLSAPTPRVGVVPACLAVCFAAAFGLLLASFPARNAEVWGQLADGRAVAGGEFARLGPGWLSKVVAYLVLVVGGSGGVVAGKALLVAGLAGVLVRLSRTTGPWWLATGCVALGLLAVGNRVLLQPATVSYLFLGITLWVLSREAPAGRPNWVSVPLLALFWVWANADAGFVIGLGVVAVYRVGEVFDRRGHDLRRLVSVLSLVGVCALTPSHVTAFRWPSELLPPADATGGDAVATPFAAKYFAEFGNSPAAMAYFPLLAVSGLSFLGALREWRWQRFLPWVGLALLSAWQVRTVPFFAVVAGPVLAWNLQAFLARRAVRPLRPTGRVAATVLLGLAAAGLLVAAWPGWLQRPPYEPRGWGFDLPAGVERAANAVAEWRANGSIPADARVLHASRDTASGFAWYSSGDDGLTDPEVVTLLVGDDAGKGADEGKAFAALRARRVGLVVAAVSGGGRSDMVLARLLTDPDRWPLLHLDGGVAVFGWRDPKRADDPYRHLAVDFDRLAFRPTEGARPPASPPPAEEPQWWHQFTRPVRRSADRDEAALLVLKAEAEKQMAPDRRYREWSCRNAGELVGVGFGGGIARPLLLDLTVRVLLIERPPNPTPDSSAGPLLAGVRVARRAATAAPADTDAQFRLGQLYLRLGNYSIEREWGDGLPRLRQLRQVQAVAALTRAVALDPNNSQAHLDLGKLYLELNCGDLSVTHLQRYRELVKRRKGATLDPRASDEQFERLSKELDRVRKVFADQPARGLAADQAAAADQLGLSQTALALLLDSDPAALGTDGVRLEIGLLLRTGRGAEVLAADPKLKDALGGDEYHWLRALAHLGRGDYAAADGELAEMLKDQPTSFGVIRDPYTPRQATDIAAMLVAEGMLAQRPGENSLEAMIGRFAGERKFAEGLGELVEVIAHQNDVNALRGLVALEAGDIPAAKRHFEAVTAFTTDRTSPGPLRGAHVISTTCLGWLRDAERR